MALRPCTLWLLLFFRPLGEVRRIHLTRSYTEGATFSIGTLRSAPIRTERSYRPASFHVGGKPPQQFQRFLRSKTGKASGLVSGIVLGMDSGIQSRSVAPLHPAIESGAVPGSITRGISPSIPGLVFPSISQ